MAHPRDTYHHPDLPAALVQAVLALVGERGVRGFSLAEAARRAGVSGSAPYRHYADRSALLAAVAVEAYGELEAVLRAAARRGRSPATRLSAMAAAYVRFAHERRAQFAILFDSGLAKADYPLLQQAGDAANGVFMDAVAAACDGDHRAAIGLALGLRAAVHGFATLLLDGTLAATGLAPAAVERAAAETARALVAGTLLERSVPSR